jgi:hypothetical protein
LLVQIAYSGRAAQLVEALAGLKRKELRRHRTVRG